MNKSYDRKKLQEGLFSKILFKPKTHVNILRNFF